MTTWFTSDTHFGHKNIIRLSKRPFANASEMDAAIIERWNAVVKPTDDVWHLGDFAFRAGKGHATEIFGKLNGHKRLIIGNHDDAEVLGLAWAETPLVRTALNFGGKAVVLDHYLLDSWDGLYRGALHFHGHEHGNCDDWQNRCDMGVDCWNYTPVTYEQVREKTAALPRLNPQERRRPAV